MSSHVQQAGLLSGRSMTLMAVIGLHALVIAALVAIRIVPELTKPDNPLIWFPAVQPPDPLPPEPTLKLPEMNPSIQLIEPVVQIPVVIDQVSDQLIAVAESASVPVAATAISGSTATVTQPPPARISTELQYRITRPSDEYYPSTSVMLEEQGIAIVQVCVDAAGRMSGKPTIQGTSGHKRLDQAAVRWASESLKFTPATVDGRGVPGCKGFRVNFDLR